MSRVIFPEWTETLKKAIKVLVIGAPIYLVLLLVLGVGDGKAIRIGYQPEQPVPYSHARHAGELGIDCRYCHSTVEKGAKAAIPSANICMNCHSQVLADDPRLLPIRQAYAEGTPVRWVRVHDLPDFVYFNHSAHVTRGVGCEQCHGRVDTKVKVDQETPLTMSWCLDCHRNPEPNLREPKDVTVMGFKRDKDPGVGARVKKMLNLNPPTDCSTCHR
jgi:menaquinone reductase, multiheme cytochrome c subunit